MGELISGGFYPVDLRASVTPESPANEILC